MKNWKFSLGTLAVLCAAGCGLQAQAPANIKSLYAKHEYQIPMRDGIQLYAVVYSPRDTSKTYPILLTRTPYSAGPYGPDAYRKFLAPSPAFVKAGYIFAFEDVRGRYRSQGTFVDMRPILSAHNTPQEIDPSTDTYDTVEWLVKHVPDNNGKVGLWGISYPGFFAAAGLVNAPPALKAVSPEAPQTDWFVGDDVHHHGAFWLVSLFDFATSCDRLRNDGSYIGMHCGRGFKFPSPDGYQFFLHEGPLSNLNANILHGQSPIWNQTMAHDTYDAFWQSRDLLPHLRNVRPAVLAVSGWYDANDFYGTLHVFQTVKRTSPAAPDYIAVGPWFHGEWMFPGDDRVGQMNFGASPGEYYRQNVVLPFFNYYLKGIGPLDLPKATVYDTGTDQWHKFRNWPPETARPESIYLKANKGLALTSPRASADPYDQYVSDPANPVPFLGVPTTQMNPGYMGYDQTFATKRPDVLVYQGPVLRHDLTVAGPLTPELFVSSSGTDSDYVVKLIDVHPGTGFEEMVRGDVFRAKFRHSLEWPQPLVPGKVTKIQFTMDDVFHTFKAGHRIMVQIESTWFPLVDLNPQRFEDIYRAQAGDFHAATERIYHSARYPSRIEILSVPAAH
ncbi:MAG: CocE/NonD family hydrolase [Terriglobales bacterium]